MSKKYEAAHGADGPQNFGEFFPYYLREHAHQCAGRALHYIGTTLVWHSGLRDLYRLHASLSLVDATGRLFFRLGRAFFHRKEQAGHLHLSALVVDRRF